MKKLLPYLKDYRRDCILAPFLKLCEASLELLVPLVVQAMIDTGIDGNAGKGYIIRMSLVLVAFALVGLIFSVTAQYFSARAATGFSSRVRWAIFDKFMSLSFTDIDSTGRHAMLSRMTGDTAQLQTGVNLTLRLFLRSPFVVFGAAIMAFTVNTSVAAVFIPVIAVLCAVVFGIMLYGVPLYKKAQARLDKILSSTLENLSGARVVRAFGLEQKQRDDYKRESEELLKRQKIAAGFSSLLNPVTFIVINVGIVVALVMGGEKIHKGEMTTGEMVAIYGYLSQILVELIKMANLIITMTKSFAAASRIESCLEKPDEKLGQEIIEKGTALDLRFENVCFCYSGNKGDSLENISFSAKSGEHIGIIGGTGSGKTTLVNLAAGLYPSKGVYLNSKPIGEYTVEALRENIGYVMQKAEIFRGTVRDNLRIRNRGADDGELESALKAASAYDFIMEKGGLDKEVTQGSLSGGQKQRLSIARAIVGKPAIIIFDDSSSALDYATDAKVRAAVRRLEWNPTVLTVSQRTSSVMDCDRIIVLDKGKTVGIGTHAELLSTCSVYKEIYDSQYKED